MSKNNMEQNEAKHLVRIVNTDVLGSKTVLYSLRKIKGVSTMFANAVLSVAGVDKAKKAGVLTEAEIKRIEEVLRNPLENKIPVWMLNRRKDYTTGDDKHLLTSDLEFQKTNDVKRLMKIKSYRGLRLSWGLTVRGQRTKSNFRRNKGKVTGVKRKK